MSYYDYPAYVSVKEKKRKSENLVNRMRKKGEKISPVQLAGRKITTTFWGDAWCRNLESYSDYENRLPRGRSYVRNGSVVDLKIQKGKINAKVSGTSVYDIEIDIKPISKTKWDKIVDLCSGEIGSLVELLQGSISNKVMEIVTLKSHGLFPSPGEISMGCDCPDWASLCKHLAAVLYGIGSRLDIEPEMLFTLRGVNPADLVQAAMEKPIGNDEQAGEGELDSDELSSVFGIEIAGGDEAETEGDSRAANAKLGKPKKKTAVAKTQKTATKAKTSSAKGTKTVTAKKRIVTRKTAAQKKSTASSPAKQKSKSPVTKVATKKATAKAATKKTTTKATAPKTKAKTVKTAKSSSSTRKTNQSSKKTNAKSRKVASQRKVYQSTHLNKSEVLAIRNAFKQGESKSSLARRFGSTTNTITNAIEGLKGYAQF